MTLLEQAEELRDRMCSQAPEAITAEIGDNRWALAILCSEAFWKIQAEMESESSLKDPMEERAVNLFAEGRTATYITFCLWLNNVQEAVSLLQRAKIPVTEDPTCNYDAVLNRLSTTGAKAYCIPKSKLKPTYADQQELTVIKLMLKTGMSLNDAALHAGRMVASIANDVLDKRSGSYNEYSMIGKLWQRGFSVRCISYITCIGESRVVQLLRELNCTTMQNTAFDFNVSDVNASGEKERVGGFITPHLQKRQLCIPEGCSKSTTEVVINKMRNDSKTYTSTDVGRMFGVPAHIAEKICDEHYFVLADKRW